MQDTQVSETKEFRTNFFVRGKKKQELASVEANIVSYRGPLHDPKWKEKSNLTGEIVLTVMCRLLANASLGTTADEFSTLCTISADTSAACKNLAVKHNQGRAYYELSYDVIIMFGCTELSAQIEWTEKVCITSNCILIFSDPRLTSFNAGFEETESSEDYL
jgi:hypothetical protein